MHPELRWDVTRQLRIHVAALNVTRGLLLWEDGEKLFLPCIALQNYPLFLLGNAERVMLPPTEIMARGCMLLPRLMLNMVGKVQKKRDKDQKGCV